MYTPQTHPFQGKDRSKGIQKPWLCQVSGVPPPEGVHPRPGWWGSQAWCRAGAWGRCSVNARVSSVRPRACLFLASLQIESQDLRKDWCPAHVSETSPRGVEGRDPHFVSACICGAEDAGWGRDWGPRGQVGWWAWIPVPRTRLCCPRCLRPQLWIL